MLGTRFKLPCLLRGVTILSKLRLPFITLIRRDITFISSIVSLYNGPSRLFFFLPTHEGMPPPYLLESWSAQRVLLFVYLVLVIPQHLLLIGIFNNNNRNLPKLLLSSIFFVCWPKSLNRTCSRYKFVNIIGQIYDLVYLNHHQIPLL